MAKYEMFLSSGGSDFGRSVFKFNSTQDLGECKTMGTPPKGVDDVFAATMVLLAGTSPSVITTKAGKVKDRSWDASKKQLLGEGI